MVSNNQTQLHPTKAQLGAQMTLLACGGTSDLKAAVPPAISPRVHSCKNGVPLPLQLTLDPLHSLTLLETTGQCTVGVTLYTSGQEVQEEAARISSDPWGL